MNCSAGEAAAQRSRLEISNVYGHGFDAGERARLESLGFRLRPETSRFAGAQVCSFLDFARGPALELIEVEDARVYREFAPAGMEPFCPGLALYEADGSSASIAGLAAEFAELGPYTVHVSYDGSDDPADPGWNYLNFATPLVPGTFVWFTALDEPRPVRSPPRVHPNGVIGVSGLVFDLSIGELGRLVELTRAWTGGGAVRIGEVDVWADTMAAALPTGRGKTFPLTAVVLEAPSLDPFAGADGAIESSIGSEPAVLVRTNPRSWDLVVRLTTPTS